jgi:hypothetical protein
MSLCGMLCEGGGPPKGSHDHTTCYVRLVCVTRILGENGGTDWGRGDSIPVTPLHETFQPYLADCQAYEVQNQNFPMHQAVF